jgi:hypothetical protein
VVRFVAVYVPEVANEIFVKVTLSVDDCHWIVPVLPLSVSTELLVPVHTVVLPLTVPATEVGFTVTVTVLLVAGLHTPLVTTARKYVVALKLEAT